MDLALVGYLGLTLDFSDILARENVNTRSGDFGTALQAALA